ncbi:MAG TPA: SAM-dependent methyltransferase, partial [Candidatus Paceibacterota bacterium]|nr:SAM-dependent methyltransferase [Candidatus Paceibacterota bacterium]
MKTPAEIIRREIAERGVLPFARFMELALYAPDCGYYEAQPENVGRRGDFYTNVSVGNLFGELLAYQFAEWLEELQIADCRLQIVEAGAHDGRLAADILTWLQLNRPKLFAQIEYGVIEPSARRQEWQRETLKPFAPRVRWFPDFEDFKLKIKNSKPAGIIFANELLDAMPVHRFGWDANGKKWFEWGVTMDGEKFVWAKIQKPRLPLPSSIPDVPSSLSDVLPDNYTVENSPAAENWWREAAGVLENGKLLTMDYGLSADELISPARTNGTLRACFRHHFSDDIL